ncbi:MAG: hypothetical protein ACRD7E_23830 [Bryobacteraceae bacterium]
MSANITRRQLAGLASAAPLLGQQSSADKPDVKNADLLASARKQVEENHQRLVNYDIPIATEPGFLFKP